MALYKAIRQDDGVTTNYHRILLLTQTINHITSIEVLSYIDDQARVAEKSSSALHPYQRHAIYEIAYNPDMTVESAYEYLKTLPRFAGATDV